MATREGYIVTVIDAETRELIEQSEEPVELKYLTAEGRDVAESAFWIINSRLRAAQKAAQDAEVREAIAGAAAEADTHSSDREPMR